MSMQSGRMLLLGLSLGLMPFAFAQQALQASEFVKYFSYGGTLVCWPQQPDKEAPSVSLERCRRC